MKKKYILIIGSVLIVSIAVAVFIIFVYFEEKTPVIKNVKRVYLHFIEADRLFGGSDGADYTRKEINDKSDKEYLINLFNGEYELSDVKCGCPCDNIRVVFETDYIVHTFGIGVIGDGNLIYHNSGKYFGLPYEQYMEFMAFLSKFDETADYDESWINDFR